MSIQRIEKDTQMHECHEWLNIYHHLHVGSYFSACSGESGESPSGPAEAPALSVLSSETYGGPTAL